MLMCYGNSSGACSKREPLHTPLLKRSEILSSLTASSQCWPSSQPLGTLAMCVPELGHNAGMPRVQREVEIISRRSKIPKSPLKQLQ